MKKNLMFLALAALGLASCNGGFKKGNGGMLYDIHVDKGATRIKEGDFISLQLIAKTDGDSVLMSTYEQGRPILTLLQKAQTPGDIFAGVKLLGEGDSAWQTWQYQLKYVEPSNRTSANLGLFPNLFNSEGSAIIMNGKVAQLQYLLKC